MFWVERRRQKRQMKALEYERKHFERMIGKFLKHKNLTVSLARVEAYVEFGFKPDSFGGPFSDTARWSSEGLNDRFFGIAHEEWGIGDYSSQGLSPPKWIRATVTLSKGEPKSPHLGYGSFYASGSSSEKDVPYLNRQLSVEVILHDERNELFSRLQDALRDAAISGNQFMHLHITFEEMAVEPALTNFCESGTSFTLYVTSVSFSPHLVLPKAPSWGWRWSLP